MITRKRGADKMAYSEYLSTIAKAFFISTVSTIIVAFYAIIFLAFV